MVDRHRLLLRRRPHLDQTTTDQQDAPSGSHGNGQAFTAGISITGNGAVAVTRYDLHLGTSAPGVPTERWMVTCRGPACTRPQRHAGRSGHVETVHGFTG
jgi:hypothetical protein